MRRPLPLVVAIVVLAAGCGGKANYTRAKTRACLAEHARIGGKLDFVASTATGGAFVAHLDGNFVTVLFGEDESDAEELEGAYQRFAFPNVRVGLPDVLRREGNAVMLWHEHPSDDELETVEDCLT